MQITRGLRPEQIEYQNTTLRVAIVRGRLRVAALKQIVAELPDQALSYGTIFPSLLSWPSLTETVRAVTKKYGGRAQIHSVWGGVRARLEREINLEKDRFDALENLSKLDTNKLVFDFDWSALENEADSRSRKMVESLRGELRSISPSSGRSTEAAVEEVSRAIIQQVGVTVAEHVRQ